MTSREKHSSWRRTRTPATDGPKTLQNVIDTIDNETESLHRQREFLRVAKEVARTLVQEKEANSVRIDANRRTNYSKVRITCQVPEPGMVNDIPGDEYWDTKEVSWNEDDRWKLTICGKQT